MAKQLKEKKIRQWNLKNIKGQHRKPHTTDTISQDHKASYCLSVKQLGLLGSMPTIESYTNTVVD